MSFSFFFHQIVSLTPSFFPKKRQLCDYVWVVSANTLSTHIQSPHFLVRRFITRYRTTYQSCTEKMHHGNESTIFAFFHQLRWAACGEDLQWSKIFKKAVLINCSLGLANGNKKCPQFFIFARSQGACWKKAFILSEYDAVWFGRVKKITFSYCDSRIVACGSVGWFDWKTKVHFLLLRQRHRCLWFGRVIFFRRKKITFSYCDKRYRCVWFGRVTFLKRFSKPLSLTATTHSSDARCNVDWKWINRILNATSSFLKAGSIEVWKLLRFDGASKNSVRLSRLGKAHAWTYAPRFLKARLGVGPKKKKKVKNLVCA